MLFAAHLGDDPVRRHGLAVQADAAVDLSARHLSFVETGRSRPSPDVIERLCEELEVPLRERNRLHLAAGFAPLHPERPLADIGEAGAAVDALLAGHEPYPAMAVNVRWELLAGNRPARAAFGDVAPSLLEPPVNVLRNTLHPDGLARQLGNYSQWRTHILRRVRRQLDRTAAPGLAELLAEIASYPVPAGNDVVLGEPGDPVIPMLLRTPGGPMRLLYTLTVFGAARDVTTDEVAVESFFPADPASRQLLQELAAGAPSHVASPEGPDS
ncbi:helix-turn-helix transcriptional regulator [Prauserella halophila]|uniref:Helix-turn-helix transcriptional regulator n=1 Tax=Prauserella halophila TaxID=185641 RepID=A0ABN1W4J1_9PSEU|nr:helix-turn-helix transcriptional regulator [Prauserella halophila]MCP2236008.1 transcriptional regulator, XRE family [Prauserella halophila]